MTPIRNLVEEVLHSKSLQIAALIGTGGMALTVANLMFAAVLTPEDYGRFALIQAFLSIGLGVGPLGFDNLALRNELPRRLPALGLAGSVSTATALVLVTAAFFGYEITFSTAAVLFAACASGAFARVCAGFEQGVVRLFWAQFIIQLPYLVLAVAAVILLIMGYGTFSLAMLALMAGCVLSAVFGAVQVLRLGYPAGTEPDPSSFLTGIDKWKRAGTFVGIAGSGYLLLQVERLIIPKTLGVEALATFHVAWTLIGAPFKLLRSGIGYALVPQLRTARSMGARRDLIASDFRLASWLSGLGLAMVVIFSLPLLELMYGSKYEVGLPLVIVIGLTGVVHVFYGVGYAGLNALGENRELRLFNLAGWGSLVIAVVLAVLFSRIGLVGVVIGGALGLVARGVVGWRLALASLAKGLPLTESPVPTSIGQE